MSTELIFVLLTMVDFLAVMLCSRIGLAGVQGMAFLNMSLVMGLGQK